MRRFSEKESLNKAGGIKPRFQPDNYYQSFIQSEKIQPEMRQILRKPDTYSGLSVSRPDDPSEQEADRIAEQIMRLPVSNESAPLQTKPEKASNVMAFDSGIAEMIEEERGGGVPLKGEVQEKMESLFGTHFTDVRIHSDSKANQLNQALNVQAFTTGSDIFFRQDAGTFGDISGQKLLAHELTHIIQQQNTPLGLQASAVVQRQEKEQDPPAQVPQGTPEDVLFFIRNPSNETDPGLRAALKLLDQYSSHVPLKKLKIRLFVESEHVNIFGSGLHFEGDSKWDKNEPVVRLPQEACDVIAQHIHKKASLADVYEVLRTIGHEIHHLWREKENHRLNPIQPVYEAESEKRLKQVRQNWVRAIQNGSEVIPNVPNTITRWEQIPEADRNRIETDASHTDYLEGLYQRSAYLVEEIYTKIEELAFLRIQQRYEVQATKTPSHTETSELAHLIYRLWNTLNSMVGPDQLITPKLFQKTQESMLAYLRKRYPNHNNPKFDSFEVLFYLNAIYSGQAPVFSEGRLVSSPPPDARVP